MQAPISLSHITYVTIMRQLPLQFNVITLLCVPLIASPTGISRKGYPSDLGKSSYSSFNQPFLFFCGQSIYPWPRFVSWPRSARTFMVKTIRPWHRVSFNKHIHDLEIVELFCSSCTFLTRLFLNLPGTAFQIQTSIRQNNLLYPQICQVLYCYEECLKEFLFHSSVFPCSLTPASL